jgi:alkyl hydroperoxide reductase subunit AhpF
MPLLSPGDQTKLREAFSEMTRRVRLRFFTQTFNCETCPATKQILDELPPLSDKIWIDEINIVIDKDQAAQAGIDRAPAIAIDYQDGDAADASYADTRMRFLGTPAGYEFISLVQAILLAGGRPSSLSEATIARLSSVDKPVTMQVFTTPT